jgi:hypothetical protein
MIKALSALRSLQELEQDPLSCDPGPRDFSVVAFDLVLEGSSEMARQSISYPRRLLARVQEC